MSRALAWIGPLILASCTPAAAEADPESSRPNSLAPQISLPADRMPRDIQCLVDHGVRLIEVKPAELDGDPPSYRLESDLPADELRAVSEECNKLAPVTPERTVQELRVIYDRWIDERQCLVGLGHQPAEPPSFEKFVADWKTGPWDPIEGVDVSSWTDAEYAEAKNRCTLEMFDRN